MVEMQIFALCRHASTICPFGGTFTISVSVTETRVNVPSSITSGIAREIRSMMPYFRARTIAGAKARRLLSRRSVEYPERGNYSYIFFNFAEYEQKCMESYHHHPTIFVSYRCIREHLFSLSRFLRSSETLCLLFATKLLPRRSIVSSRIL